MITKHKTFIFLHDKLLFDLLVSLLILWDELIYHSIIVLIKDWMPSNTNFIGTKKRGIIKDFTDNIRL